MEAQQNQIQTQQDGGSSGKAVASNYLCRQSTTRWTPTTDQIKILKDLYYDKGIRSPTADQIQSISATLRKFGKIEGKNVFYWFQNHKARERQKKRFSTTAVNNTATNYTEQQLIPMQRASANIRYPNLISPGINCPPPSAAGMVSVGQMVGGCGYGHMSMESNIREYGMSASGNGGICAYPSQSFQWTGVNHYPQSYSFMESSRNPSIDYQVQFLDEDEEKSPGLETLPLFPIHAEDSSVSSFYGTMMRPEPENCYTSSCHWFNGADTVSTNLTSLELSLNLNSYGDQWQNY